MNYFEKYVSNTIAGSANQLAFYNEDGNEIRKGRLFYKITKPGRYNYSFLFTNIMDSTYNDGTMCYKNMECGPWKIEEMAVSPCVNCDINCVDNFVKVTFEGKATKNVSPGEIFSSDPVSVEVPDNGYICIEIAFSGKMIPYHEETLIPTYTLYEGRWVESKFMPFPGMIGCDRKVKAKIGFLGDSITQGIGSPANSYEHWNAVLTEKSGTEYSYWNLGIGFGRANDAASDGVWLYKAKQCDGIVLCMGVNDIIQGQSEEQIKEDIMKIVKKLKESNVKVLLQTIPSFNYAKKDVMLWKNVNAYIKNEVSPLCDGYFDIVPHLAVSEEMSHMTKYGCHPDSTGGRVWAEALYPEFIKFIKIL